MLVVSQSGFSAHHRDKQLPPLGQTPLKVEQGPDGFELVQIDLRENTDLKKRRRVLSTHPTEKQAEQAAALYADGPAKPVKVRKHQPQSDKAKRMNALVVGTSIAKQQRRTA